MALDARRGDAKGTGGATPTTVRWRDRLQAAREHHRASARDAAWRLRANPVTTGLTVLLVAVALSLPALLHVVVGNLRALSGHYEGQAQISLFLSRDVDVAAQRRLGTRVSAWAEVGSVEVITPEEALAEFRQQSGLGDVLSMLEGNPLPGVVVVRPVAVSAAESLRERLATEPGVETAQLDSAWLQKLQALLRVGERLGLALGAAFALVVVLVVVNSIRLAIEARREEILVVKLVGGTDAFVRRPFLYTGFWLGLAGGLLSVGLLAVLVAWLAAPVSELAALYGASYSLQGAGAGASLALALGGAFLGWAGAWLAVARHLKEIEPR